MYTLAVEIHGLRQLERLQPELITDIRRRVIAVIEVQGGTFVDQYGELWIFRFERARPDDRQGVLDALSQSVASLEARENELAGWGVVLDYLELSAAEAKQRIHDELLPIYEDNAAWVGEAAHSLLAHHLDVEEAPRAPSRLRRVAGRSGADGDEIGSVVEVARSERAVEAVLEEFVPDDLVGGMLLVVSEDRVATRVNLRAALQQLVGSSPAVRWLEAEAAPGHHFAPLVSAFSALDVHETGFWLRDAERGVWDERSPLVTAVLSRTTGVILPDAYDTDLLIAFETFLVAYVRRAAASVVPPVLLCHNIDRWPDEALDALARTVARLPVPEHDPALILIGTSARTLSTAAVAPLIRCTLRLPRPTPGELREKVPAETNWERLTRVTGGRSAAVVHYLSNARHWDSLTDGALENVDDADLSWRVVSSQDSELQELLLAAHYASAFVSRDKYTELAVRLGTDRVRVPTTLARLRALGLIEERDDVVPIFPEHEARLETALGRASRTVHDKVACFLAELASRGEVALSEELVRFLAGYNDGEYLPRFYHDLLTRVMSERRLEEAHRLLYDAVPPRGFHPTSRACMHAVVAADRLRLALLQRNKQTAERTRAASDRNADLDECDFAAGDLAVQKARLTFEETPSRETIALLKRAIMVYQELDDQAGLARANLDFGLVLLAQEDLLGAREYFLLGGKSAVSGTDVLEQMRARELMLVCDYVYGNLSRSLAQADDLDERAGRAGMREVQLFCELARGRIAFELGRYEEAADIFSRGRSRARLYGMASAGVIMERWIARSLVYDGKFRRGVAMLRDQSTNPESLFFTAEALLRMGEHGEAIKALEAGLERGPVAAGPVEAIAWGSGFAAMEDRAVGAAAGTKVLEHQMMALRGYLLAQSGRIADGVQEMHRLTRELRISEIDPYNRIYFYLYSLILPESGELNVEDGTTVLGKAVRYIQQRTSRMDEYAHKTDFLSRNYWNARLMSHAQAHNLV